VDAPLLPAKLEPIADTQPVIADKLAKTLDQILAGEDIRPRTTADLAALVTPDTVKWIQQRLPTLWPGGKLTLVKRIPLPDKPGQFMSIFRLSKGSDALLLPFGLAPDGKISTLGFSPDREYE
jgi:hypothetical protein